MKLKKLPSIISETEFDDRGFAKTESGLLVPAYIASEMGFYSSGKEFLTKFYGRLKEEAKVLPLCPFTACREYLDLSKLEEWKTIDEKINFWDEFNSIVGPVNYETLMPKSKIMIAILDGGPSIDDGVAAEIGHYATKYKKKPIIGIRSDFRSGENPATPINPAVRYFLDKGPYKNSLLTGPSAYENTIASLPILIQLLMNDPVRI